MLSKFVKVKNIIQAWPKSPTPENASKLQILVRVGFELRNTPYSKMAANKLFFCLHVHKPSLPHFHFKILLFFIHVGEAKRAN